MNDLATILEAKYGEIDFLKEVILQDDGNGSYIKQWNREEKKPTKAELEHAKIDLDTEIKNKKAVRARKYPPVQEQLDMLYWDKVNNTNKWQEAIAAVKAANPKVGE